MSLPSKSRRWVIAKSPTDDVSLSGPDATFRLEEHVLPPLQQGQLLLKTLYLSNDPAQRGWIDANPGDRLYVTPIVTGELMRAGGIAEVIDSKDDKFKKGAMVSTQCGWEEYHIKSVAEVQPIRQISGLSPTQYLGALGGTGLTAYVGLVNIAELKAGESVVISGAAGATGSMAVQIAKHIIGAGKVIGIAGSDEKCRWVEKLGADVCVNYKKSDWKEQLAKATEGFVDAYFDNVGDEQLDFMLTRLKNFGRVAACGAIADYNKGEKGGLKNWFHVIIQRLNIKGFIVLDHLRDGNAAKITEILSKAAESGKISIGEENETVVPTKFEDIPKTWVKLFEGANTGKLVTKISEGPRAHSL
jgi:NADPH-dependent curcumin reductase CurA